MRTWRHNREKELLVSVEGFAVNSHLKYNTALDEVIKRYLPLSLPVKLFDQCAVELIRQTVTCQQGEIIHDKCSWQRVSPHKMDISTVSGINRELRIMNTHGRNHAFRLAERVVREILERETYSHSIITFKAWSYTLHILSTEKTTI